MARYKNTLELALRPTSDCTMYSFKFLSLLSVAVAATAVRGGSGPLIVNTPASVVLCEPVLVTWEGGIR